MRASPDELEVKQYDLTKRVLVRLPAYRWKVVTEIGHVQLAPEAKQCSRSTSFIVNSTTCSPMAPDQRRRIVKCSG
jgi:hypothetical protein